MQRERQRVGARIVFPQEGIGACVPQPLSGRSGPGRLADQPSEVLINARASSA